MRDQERRRGPQAGNRPGDPLDPGADVLRLRARDQVGRAPGHLEHPQRDDERGDRPEDRDQAVDQAADPAHRQAGREGQPERPAPIDQRDPQHRPAENASTEPTERSIPPTTRTSVIPTDTTVRSGYLVDDDPKGLAGPECC